MGTRDNGGALRRRRVEHGSGRAELRPHGGLAAGRLGERGEHVSEVVHPRCSVIRTMLPLGTSMRSTRVHQLAHQEQPAAVFAIQVVRLGRIDERGVEVEARPLVAHFDDEALARRRRARTCTCLAGSSPLPRRIAFESASVSATGTLSDDLPLREAHEFALTAHQLDDALDEANVARDVDFDDPDARPGRSPV